MAGHSHWAKIKRAKGANDAKRGKIWSKIARKIIIAARSGGDPRDNLALRYTIEEAKAANMPKDTIEKAILKGTGELGGENYEAAVYEGYGPGGVAFLIEALTNNRSRTAPEMRKIFEIAGGNLASSGSVSFQFSQKGVVTIRREAVDEERLMDLSLDAGAEDVVDAGEVWEVLTPPAQFHRVKEAIAAAGIAVENAELANLPLNTVALDPDTAAKVRRLIDALEDHDDVQNVFHNADLPDEAA